MSNNSSFIMLKEVSKSFQVLSGKCEVIKNLNFSLEKGDNIVITGRSGSGKSTLLALIGGVLPVDNGSIIIDGKELSSMNEGKRRKFRKDYIGYIYQFAALIPELTVVENVQRYLFYKDYTYDESLDLAESALKTVNLASRMNSFPNTLSGGEKLRVAIARVLALNPSIILADEPTGRLGDVYAYEIIQTLVKLSKENSISLICVTHRNDFIKFFDDSYELINGGLIPNKVHS